MTDMYQLWLIQLSTNGGSSYQSLSSSAYTYDIDTNIFYASQEILYPTQVVNKQYVDASVDGHILCLGSSTESVVATSSLTTLQAFTIAANSLKNPGDKIVYTSNLNITSEDILQFEFNGSVLSTYTAPTLLVEGYIRAIFEINYIDSSDATFYITVLSNAGAYVTGGTIAEIDWTSTLDIQTNGQDNSLVATYTSYNANLLFIPG